MSRYFHSYRRPYVEDERFDGEAPLTPIVNVPEHEAVDTGLVWSDGSTIWRAPNPIGFGAKIE